MPEPRAFLDGRVLLHPGSMLEVLPKLAANSIDACVTDGPYFLPEMLKRHGSKSASPSVGPHMYSKGSKTGFHGKADIVGDICNKVSTWRKVYRVLKPGAHLLAFNCAKSYHLMATAAEKAGFEVRDILTWHYATGFPHGKPLAKLIDRRLLGGFCDDDELARGPVSHTAAYFEGHDITLKPSSEFILLARKPFKRTIGDCLIENKTGALNIRGCRVQHETGSSYPANVMHDGSAAIAELFPTDVNGRSAKRFFFCPKADALDRDGSRHPTVKPISLIQELVRLVAEPGATILDPFAGSGTTALAALREGVRSVLVEIDEQYQEEMAGRFERVLAGPDERRRNEIKATVPLAPFEAGTLFAGIQG